jgi:hypothetical protein
VDSAESVNGPPPGPPADYQKGYIFTKATLVIVPGHLMGQWPDEIKKFVSGKKVCIIKDMASLSKLNLEDVTNADILVVNFTVLANEKYYTRLGRLSGVDPWSLRGQKAGRHFEAVYHQCLSSLPRRVEEIVSGKGDAYASIENDAKVQDDTTKLTLDNKKTAYKKGGPGKTEQKTQKKIEKSELDPWGLSTPAVKRSNAKMKCPPLEMFFWTRIVVDEYVILRAC